MRRGLNGRIEVQYLHGGSGYYAYDCPFDVSLGDVVEVSSAILDRQEAVVVRLESDYVGPARRVLGVLRRGIEEEPVAAAAVDDAEDDEGDRGSVIILTTLALLDARVCGPYVSGAAADAALSQAGFFRVGSQWLNPVGDPSEIASVKPLGSPLT